MNRIETQRLAIQEWEKNRRIAVAFAATALIGAIFCTLSLTHAASAFNYKVAWVSGNLGLGFGATALYLSRKPKPDDGIGRISKQPDVIIDKALSFLSPIDAIAYLSTSKTNYTARANQYYSQVWPYLDCRNAGNAKNVFLTFFNGIHNLKPFLAHEAIPKVLREKRIAPISTVLAWKNSSTALIVQIFATLNSQIVRDGDGGKINNWKLEQALNLTARYLFVNFSQKEAIGHEIANIRDSLAIQAAKRGHLLVVQLMLAHGANLDERIARTYITPLAVIFLKKNWDPEVSEPIFSYLRYRYKNPGEKPEPLFEKKELKKAAKIATRCLLANKSQEIRVSDEIDALRQHTLSDAARQGDLFPMCLLRNHGARSSDKIIEYAVSHGEMHALSDFLKDCVHSNPAKLLFDSLSSPEAVQWIFETHKIDVNCFYNDRTPLLAALEQENFCTGELLLEMGADVNLMSLDGHVAMDFVRYNSKPIALRIMRSLINRGANPKDVLSFLPR